MFAIVPRTLYQLQFVTGYFSLFIC